MGKIVQFTANCKPSALMKNMLRHQGDVSEGTQFKVLARRRILKRDVTFYHNGLRFIEGTDLNEQEMHESEILRLAHASILISAPVGDKKLCYVDATKNPVEVWIYDMPIKRFLETSKRLIETQQLGIEFLLEEPIRKTVEKKNERNERLFRKQSCNARLPYQLLVEAERFGDVLIDN